MVFRFVAAIALVVATALVGAMLEKQALALRRQVSQQQYRLAVLEEQHAKLRLQAQWLGAPHRWLAPLDAGRLGVTRRPETTIVASSARGTRMVRSDRQAVAQPLQTARQRDETLPISAADHSWSKPFDKVVSKTAAGSVLPAGQSALAAGNNDRRTDHDRTGDRAGGPPSTKPPVTPAAPTPSSSLQRWTEREAGSMWR